jgi:hypothetical protein
MSDTKKPPKPPEAMKPPEPPPSVEYGPPEIVKDGLRYVVFRIVKPKREEKRSASDMDGARRCVALVRTECRDDSVEIVDRHTGETIETYPPLGR